MSLASFLRSGSRLVRSSILLGIRGGVAVGTAVPLARATIKVSDSVARIAQANVEAASRESSHVGAAVRGVTGISLDSIRAEGLLGGNNSEARRILRGFGL